MRRIVELNLLVGLMLFTSVICVDGQGKQRIINELYLPNDAPIQVIGRELEGRKFEDRRLGNKISGLANSDWIKHLTFIIKNVSKKNISFVEITLMVPRQKQMPGPVMFYAMFGSRDGTGINGLISRGEEARIKVRDSEYLGWEKRLKEWSVDDFDSVLLQLRAVYFDDGTGWSLGRDLIQDPLNPKHWHYVDQPKPKPNSLTSLFWLHPIRLDAGFFLTTATPETVVCGWGLIQRTPRECQGCTDPADTATCDQYFDDTFYLQPTGDAPAGFLTTDVRQDCTSTSPTSNCGSCPASGFTSDIFTPFTNCGQPQTCGNISTWGCASPLVDVNGICQRSFAYQQACAWGYDGLACECNFDPCYGDGSDPSCYADYGCGYYRDGRDGGLCKPFSCLDCYVLGGYWCDAIGNCWTPIVIDIDGDGFALTSASHGVWFRPSPSTNRIRTAWTSHNDDDSLLVLDINANGAIDDGSELFGCSSPQPVPPPGQIGNGFLALAEHDKLERGGNADGQIDSRDQVFLRLKLWRDRNHDGLSEPGELKRLINSDVRVIELEYRESSREDEHGNKFKYRAIVRDAQGAQVGRWAWDVFPRVAR